MQNSMKKVKAAEATGVVTEGGAKTTAKAKGTPKKRKGTDDEEAAEESPKSKKGKKGKKGKKEVTPGMFQFVLLCSAINADCHHRGGCRGCCHCGEE